MAKKIDINEYIGRTINYLTIVEELEPYFTSGGNKKRVIKCSCKCGLVSKFYLVEVLSSIVKSCGCYSKEKARERAIKRNTKHNMYGTPEYLCWDAMKKRCLNPNHKSYKDYGGRGIKICESWINNFENFLKDVGFRPSLKHSLDRIDNNKGYSKENCRWATKKQQGRNQRSNVLITINGLTKTIAEWSEITGLKWQTIHYRVFISKMPETDWLKPV